MMVLIVLLVICVILIAIAWYSGLFSSLNVRIDKSRAAPGPLEVHYKVGKGPYWTVGTSFKELATLVPRDACLIGIYYDDPKTTPSAECRWAVGVVTKSDTFTLTENFTKQLTNWGYSSHSLPAINKAVIAQHPWTSIISIYLAPMRVYHAMAAFMQAHKLSGYPALELYCDSQIEYCMPLEQHEQYYVPGVDKPKSQ